MREMKDSGSHGLGIFQFIVKFLNAKTFKSKFAGQLLIKKSDLTEGELFYGLQGDR